MSNDAKRVDVSADDAVLRDQALAAFLRQIETRPLDAHVANDHLASLRVLQTCGLAITGEDQEYSHRADTRLRNIF